MSSNQNSFYGWSCSLAEVLLASKEQLKIQIVSIPPEKKIQTRYVNILFWTDVLQKCHFTHYESAKPNVWNIILKTDLQCKDLPAGLLFRTEHNGPLTRYVKLQVAHAPGIPGTFPPPPTSKETASKRSRRASRHVRDASGVMHVGIAYPRWRGKTFPAFPAHAHPQFYVYGKRPISCNTNNLVIKLSTNCPFSTIGRFVGQKEQIQDCFIHLMRSIMHHLGSRNRHTRTRKRLCV